MKSSKRVTELNNRSVELTDAELRFVDKFSVSLPMNELPEVVVVSPQPVAPRRNYDGPATIPFKLNEPESNDRYRETNQSLNSALAKLGSQAATRPLNPSTSEPENLDAEAEATTDSDLMGCDSNGISLPDIQDAESVLLDTHSNEGASHSESSASERSSEFDLPTESNDTAEFNKDFASDLELPQDELDIFHSDGSSADRDVQSNEAFPDHENIARSDVTTEPEDVASNTTAIYRIEDHALYEERFERIAKSIEAELENKPSSVVLITSPTPSDLFSDTNSIQDTTANNLLSVLANRNPTMRIISVQANYSSTNRDEQFSPGLGEVLSEENELEDAVIPTTIDNLDYLAFSDCGSVLSSSFKPRAMKIMSELRKHYDLIFINGKSAEEMETKAWTAIADATYLNVQLYGDDKVAAKEAATQLRKNGGRLVGCIVIEPE